MRKVTGNKSHIGLAILVVLMVASVCYPLAGWLGYRSVALILLLAVSILAMRLGLTAVLIAAAVSALVWDFFFIPPFFTFTVSSSEDALLIMMYFIVALLNGVINYRVRQLEQAKTQSEERANALQLYNTLFSSLSHELRTPIATIIGATDTLQESDHLLTREQKEDLLSGISRGALRLSEQVENLLNMSRLEAGIIQPRKAWCDLSDLIYGSVTKLKFEARNHVIEIHIPDEFPLVQLDFGLTEQTIHNLLSNALRHTPAGTKITLKAFILKDVSGHFEEEDQLSIVSVRDAAVYRLIIAVMDDGPGFPVGEMDYAFDKFYRHQYTKVEGTGLGLYIVKGFTEAQGGAVVLTNRMGGGAMFELEFPTPLLNQTIHHGK